MVKGRENVTVIVLFPFIKLLRTIVIQNVAVHTKISLPFKLDKKQSFTLTLTLFGLLDQNSVTAVDSDTNVLGLLRRLRK